MKWRGKELSALDQLDFVQAFRTFTEQTPAGQQALLDERIRRGRARPMWARDVVQKLALRTEASIDEATLIDVCSMLYSDTSTSGATVIDLLCAFIEYLGACRQQHEFEKKVASSYELEAKLLRETLSTPVIEPFAEAVVHEARHQRARHGDEHDAKKDAFDWVWALAHLATKAARAQQQGDAAKALHHTVSSAALLANWHRHLMFTTTKGDCPCLPGAPWHEHGKGGYAPTSFEPGQSVTVHKTGNVGMTETLASQLSDHLQHDRELEPVKVPNIRCGGCGADAGVTCKPGCMNHGGER